MPTIHYSKKEFIDMLKDISDDDHVFLTTEVDGNLMLKNKKKFKQVPFVFASDAFAKPDTIHDLLETTMWGIILAPDSVVAEKFKRKKNANTKKG